MAGFRQFLLKSNALALAVGVIIGVALGNVVNSLVNDVLMPPIGYVLGGADFAQYKLVLKAASGTTKEVAISYGLFINAVIAFVIVALVVYLITIAFLKPPTPAPAKTCPFCRTDNAVEASRCRACTSAI